MRVTVTNHPNGKDEGYAKHSRKPAHFNGSGDSDAGVAGVSRQVGMNKAEIQ
jgi:hypothetical protein